LTSDDGVVWTERPARLCGHWLSGLAYGNGHFVAAVGALWVSMDGIEWSQAVGWRGFTSVTFGNGRLVAVNSLGSAYESEDGVEWREDASSTDHGLYGVTFAAERGRFVAVGDSIIHYTP
jgi:hypothetical protein